MWLLLTDTIANNARYEGYYKSLQGVFNDQLKHLKKIIEMDIMRTYSKEITQEQKDSLFRILYSYAKRNMETGYCQGMNIIAYFLLKVGFTEERVFWIFTYIVENLIPKGYYTNMISVISDISIFKHILSILQPSLVNRLSKLMVDINHFLVPWFLMIFTNLHNFEVV